MNNSKRSIISLLNRCVLFLLALLGFTACDTEQVCKYGSPYAAINVEGQVTNEAKEPIVGIQLKVINSDQPMDSTLTDTLGYYSLNMEGFPPPQHKITIFAEDIDADANGIYDSGSVQVVLDYNNPDGFFYGTAKVKQDFTLKNAEQELLPE